jgi:catechol 2,3-dioxygenase-like lactoylglutathione lyase family enzyme
MKTEPGLVILYVKDASASAAFYADLLGGTPVEATPNFAMFVLSSGVRLGLWSRHDVAPAVTATRHWHRGGLRRVGVVPEAAMAGPPPDPPCETRSRVHKRTKPRHCPFIAGSFC